MEKTKFSEDIQNLLDTVWKDKDMYSMSLDELKDFRAVVNNTREEYDLLQFGAKTLGNAAYGGCANPGMYFFNTELAGDITGECRATTRYMIDKVENFFRNDLWTRTDLQERFDYKLDESQHEWYNSTPIWVYSDTDSIVGSSTLKIDNGESISIENLYDKCKQYGDAGNTTAGHESHNCPFKVLNWSKKNNLYYANVKRVIRHKVSKSKFKIKTKSGKEIIVTGDHSCVVFRNGKQLTIKAKDINIKTDKILTVNNND